MLNTLDKLIVTFFTENSNSENFLIFFLSLIFSGWIFIVLLSKSESVKFSLIESVIWLFND